MANLMGIDIFRYKELGSSLREGKGRSTPKYTYSDTYVHLFPVHSSRLH